MLYDAMLIDLFRVRNLLLVQSNEGLTHAFRALSAGILNMADKNGKTVLMLLSASAPHAAPS